MESLFEKISPEDITDNIFKLIDKDWMLVTAGSLEHYNMMTASWAGFGILWHKPVAFSFIRPNRHTFQFTEKHEMLTLTFFEEKYRRILNFCGSNSGRDVDKMKESGLKPILTPGGSVGFEQATLILECKKLYADTIKPEFFLDPKIDKNYPLKDFHMMYISEITGCYTRK
ncbi:MAG: flavin reductase [Bacteroidota bacterium]